MATIGTFTLQGNVAGGLTGTRTIFSTISITAGVDQTSVVALSSGNNTVTVPTGATLAVIIGPNGATPSPNPSYGGVLTLKGVAGDTGVVMSAKNFTVLSWDTAPASFVINATVSTSVEVFFA